MKLDILIQENEGIAKFFKLMLEGPTKWSLNTIFTSSRDICIHLWNLEGYYCIVIAKPRIPSKTFFSSSLKQDVFLQFHFCLQLGCKNESFEEKGWTTIVFKDQLDIFHTSSGRLAFPISFSYRLFCVSNFVETSIKMESKLSEFGMGCSKCKH
jgi:hypothetical protein